VLSRQSCLIVDDADVVRKVMRHVVEGLGFTVEEAATTDDGLVRCRPNLPTVIVLDWHIPGSNPIEFIAAVRSLPGGKQVKILYVATNNDPVEIGRAIASGANGHMIKPFRRVTLETKVAELITVARQPVSDAGFVGAAIRNTA
jgi:two-component system, chemotaxis family, chemotaxis protein CheY